MKFLYFLESIRNPVCDFLFSGLTYLGTEAAFLVFAILMYWCVEKREGYYLFFVGFVGTVVNQVLKLICCVSRPWVKDPNFTIVESARAGATGYSFPSGHTQCVTGVFLPLALYHKKRAVSIVSVAAILTVAFSRMYLGVHTPHDVFFSLAFGAVLSLVMYPTFADPAKYEKRIPWLLFGGYLLTVGMVLFTFLYKNGGSEIQNIESARRNACSLHGGILGFALSYFLDRGEHSFSEKAPLPGQILKAVLGIGIVFAIKTFLKVPLNFLCFGNEYVGRVVRYFLIAAFAGAVWPRTFPFFAGIGKGDKGGKGAGKAV